MILSTTRQTSKLPFGAVLILLHLVVLMSRFFIPRLYVEYRVPCVCTACTSLCCRQQNNDDDTNKTSRYNSRLSGTNYSRTMTISCWSSNASWRLSRFGWCRWFMIPISFLTVFLSSGYGVLMNLATKLRPVDFSTARCTTPKAPLQFAEKKNAITKFSHLTRCPRLTRQFYFRFCSGKQSKLFYGLYALNLVHSAEVHQVERMSSLKMHSAIFVQSVQIDWLGLKGTFSTTVSCLRKVCCG